MYSIKKKSVVFQIFKEFKERVELDSYKKIKCPSTNNGREYTIDEFDTFYQQEASNDSSR